MIVNLACSHRSGSAHKLTWKKSGVCILSSNMMSIHFVPTWCQSFRQLQADRLLLGLQLGAAGLGSNPFHHPGGHTEEARTCEAWLQLIFRPQKWNLKAHMWYQLSLFPGSIVAIAMQHHPGNIHQSFATPRCSATPCYVLIQSPNAIDTISKRWRSKKAFNTSPSHPSRFKFILLVNNGIDWKDHHDSHVLSELKTSVGV